MRVKTDEALAPELCGSGASANPARLETGALVQMVCAGVGAAEELLPF